MTESTSTFGGTNYYRFLHGVTTGCEVLCLRDPFCNIASVVGSSLDDSEIGCYMYMHGIYEPRSRIGVSFWEKQCPGMCMSCCKQNQYLTHFDE